MATHELVEQVLRIETVEGILVRPVALFKTKTLYAYPLRLYPRLREASLSRIAAAIGVSIAYASEIRTGRRRPHPRHWQALAELAGAAPFPVTCKVGIQNQCLQDNFCYQAVTLKTPQCIMKKRPASEGRGCDGRRLRCAALCRGFAPLRRR
jgi:hypothetical protein